MNTIKKILKRLMRRLRFEKRIVILLFIFLFIAVAGHTQSWVFSGKDSGVAKPVLFDLMDFFPFWSIWMILLLPLIIISKFLTVINIEINPLSQSLWLLVILNVLYFYFLSRGIIMIYDWLLDRKNRLNSKNKKVWGDL